MQRKAGLNWVIAVFAQQCVLTLVPLAFKPGQSTVPALLTTAGVFFTIGAVRRQFWGFVGVLAGCVLAILLDVFVLLFEPAWTPLVLLHTFLYVTIAGGLYSARRQFPRKRT
jgi:hypothetical protein